MMRESMASARGAHSGQDRSERGCARQGGRKRI
jgi:hypothetical protein